MSSPVPSKSRWARMGGAVQRASSLLTVARPSTLATVTSTDQDHDTVSTLKDIVIAQAIPEVTLSKPVASQQLASEPLGPIRPSVISFPVTTSTTANSPIHCKEDDEDDVPYANGPTQIIPGIWLGSEDNARDWKGLLERDIKSVLNVAKEVTSPFSSTPNFKQPGNSDSGYYPPDLATARPGMHYLKLHWSHGQQNLVDVGFRDAMAFTDAALERGEGVLVYCQCGISRSAALVIALVMRASAERASSVPPEVWALEGMQGAYSFVKEKSKWVGPNMSLIYQLLEYEKKLKGDFGLLLGSERSSYADEEEEWGRRRKMLDKAPSDGEGESESAFVMREALALDKAMEARIAARKSSASVMSSSSSNSNWSMLSDVTSNITNWTMLSEDLVEEDENEELLGVGATTAKAHPWAPVRKTSFNISPPPPPPATAVRSTFIPMPLIKPPRPPPNHLPKRLVMPAPLRASQPTAPRHQPSHAQAFRHPESQPQRPPAKRKRRPVSIGILPPVSFTSTAVGAESTAPSASNITNWSMLSGDLVEEEEEEGLLDVGGDHAARLELLGRDNPENVKTVVARLAVVFGNVQQYRRLLSCQDSEAQYLLDTFQMLLDTSGLTAEFRRNLLVATQRLSKRAGLYPTCYNLQDVELESEHPVAAGSFADIYKGRLLGQIVCMKVIRLYQTSHVASFLQKFSAEAILWGQLSHPNLLPIYGLYRYTNRLSFVSPWMEHGDVNSFLLQHPDANRSLLVLDVALGIAYLHKHDIVHGDLKGANILVNDSMRACVADFGLSAVSDANILHWTSHSSAESKGGSVRWQAPELFDTDSDDVVYNSKRSDVYAFGCVAYEIFTGNIPFFEVLRDPAVMRKVQTGAQPSRPSATSPAWGAWGLTESHWSLMTTCWGADPESRPTTDAVAAHFSFPELLDNRPATSVETVSRAHFRNSVNARSDLPSVDEVKSILDGIATHSVT